MNLSLARLLIVFAAALPCQDGKDVKLPPGQTGPGPLCSKCKTTGKIENPAWKDFAALEQNARYCSYLLEKDPNGYGLPWLPCKGCRNEPLRAAAEAQFQSAAADRMHWLKEKMLIPGMPFELKGVKGVDQQVGLDLVHIQSAHFLLTFDIDHLTVGQRPYALHQAAHLYIDRLEKLYKDFLERFGLTEADLNGVLSDPEHVLHWVLLFGEQKGSVKAGPIYVGLQGQEGCKRFGRPSTFVTWWNKQKNPTDDDMHRYVIHHVSHMLLSVMGKGKFDWLGELGSGWVEEGLGHFYELEWFKESHTHCSREVNLTSQWVETDWHSYIRDSIIKKQNPPIATLDGKTADVLNVSQHVFAWSFVDYLLKAEDPKKFPAFIANVKQKWTLANAMRGVYGYNLAGFDEKWKEWVLKTYIVK